MPAGGDQRDDEPEDLTHWDGDHRTDSHDPHGIDRCALCNNQRLLGFASGGADRASNAWSIVGFFPDLRAVLPIQILDGVGVGLLEVATPIILAQFLQDTRRANVGVGAVATTQGIGAAFLHLPVPP